MYLNEYDLNLLNEIKDKLADTLVYRTNKLDLHELDIPELADSLYDLVKAETNKAYDRIGNKLISGDYDKTYTSEDIEIAIALLKEVKEPKEKTTTIKTR